MQHGPARRRSSSSDAKTGFFQIDKILTGANWDPKLRSPLTEIGVNVKDGDYIVAVNGQPTNEMTNIYEAAGRTRPASR